LSELEFAPLGGPPVAGAGFRPLLDGREAIADPEPVATPTAAEPDDELRRAFQGGYDLGREEATGQLATVAESLVKSLEELSVFRGQLRDRYERELLEVALGVARTVVQHELAERPEIWLTMLRAAVRRTVEREHIVVRVPAALATFLRERTPDLRAMLEDVKELDLVEDVALDETGCVVESRYGELDLGVDGQMGAIRAALTGGDT